MLSELDPSWIPAMMRWLAEDNPSNVIYIFAFPSHLTNNLQIL